ncbi:uncharacterized protein LOC129576771 [Sitodiplosis mosellana]|uniref:uncharacterized protein LOC129576771 n=1 Tax=Sitodiplosis mosellana TaxID=263140 RepID=UPI002444D426|nr:uncharacterized protein LOC129576771 [Sitodiplosis mosellana]
MAPMPPLPRYCPKSDTPTDYDNIFEAIKAITIDKQTYRSVAEAYNISRPGLARYIGRLKELNVDVATTDKQVLIDIIMDSSTVGRKPIFTALQERSLVKYILKASDFHYGLSITELRVLAYQYAKLIDIKYPDEWNTHQQASNDWYYAFINRHKNLSLRTPEQVSQNRAKNFNKENVDAFFDNLSSVLEQTNFEHRIWNMDECGFPTVPTKAIKVIARRGKKRVGTSTSAERGTNVSMALSVSAMGQSIPPYFLFPRKNMKEIYMTHAGQGAVGIANGCGWMTSDEFSKYMDHFITHSGARKGLPTLLLLDNHTAHLSIEAIDKAINHDIKMLSFPPHCTHRMQP